MSSLPAELVEAVFVGLERSFPHVHLHLLVDLDRTLGRPELEQALAGLVRAFPVLGCRYQQGWWRDRWVPWGGDLAERVRVERVDELEAATEGLARQPLSSTDEPPVRLTFFQQDAGGRLVLTLNHIAADGAGTRAAGAVLASLLAGREPDPPATADRRLAAVARSLRLRDLPVFLVEMVREGLLPLSMLRVRPLEHRLEPGDGGPEPCWRTVALDGAEGAAVVERARQRGATVNDLLVSALLRIAGRRGRRGPVGAAFTVDLRRFLTERRARVTNLAGVSMLVLPRARVGSATDALEATSAAIGRRKRRLLGLPYMLLPAFTLGWLPHGLARLAGAVVIRMVLRRGARAPVVTNIGSLDEALEPLGDSVRAASIVGPFLHGSPIPLVTVTGFRGALQLQVGGTGTFAPAALEAYAAELGAALTDLAIDPTSRSPSTA